MSASKMGTATRSPTRSTGLSANTPNCISASWLLRSASRRPRRRVKLKRSVIDHRRQAVLSNRIVAGARAALRLPTQPSSMACRWSTLCRSSRSGSKLSREFCQATDQFLRARDVDPQDVETINRALATPAELQSMRPSIRSWLDRGWKKGGPRRRRPIIEVIVEVSCAGGGASHQSR